MSNPAVVLASPDVPVPWHALPAGDVLARLEVDPALGLSASEVRARTSRWGANHLEEPTKRPKWLIFFDQFRNVLVATLVVGAVVAGAVGDVKDSVAIAVVLVFNALLGYVQEQKAEKSLTALREMLTLTVRLRRDGRVTEVPSQSLVPGDVVLLEAGDRVPADGRVVEAWSAEVDESSLTGESAPVGKQVDDEVDADAPLGDRTTTVLMNTQLTQGRLVVAVTATGMHTEIGQVAEMIAGADATKTPLQQQLEGLGKRLALISGGIVLVYFALGLLRGSPVSETLVSSVALLVAAIPEGLPAVVTLTLAVGTARLARRGAIVKRLASVETLGSTSVICSDKTGTLTVNQMTARAVVLPSGTARITGAGYEAAGSIGGDVRSAELHAAARVGVLCNDSDVRDGVLLGDPTEGALVVLAVKAGLVSADVRAAAPRIAEVPFDSARKLMATFHGRDDETAAFVAVKGAWEVVLDRCVLDETERTQLVGRATELASEGLRVLAVASGEVDRVEVTRRDVSDEDRMATATHLSFLGLVGLVDPPRAEVADAVAEAHRAGITVKMVTGDHVDTARAIAAQIGIPGAAIDGRGLDALDDGELADRIDDLGVIARVAPQHKVRIVKALRDRGAVVAMTGDGVNDAPALTVADIGVAMGHSGTEVAKEASDMVLADDNFATITSAVGQGRTIYANIVKFVRFQVATNIGALTALIGAQLANLPTPFNPIQLLWINLIMDGPPAMALGVDPASPGVMDRPPRASGEEILNRKRLRSVTVTGVVMAAGTLAVLVFAQHHYGTDRALTLAFTTFVLFQVVNALSVRDEFRTVFSTATLQNPQLLAALSGVVILQLFAVYVPVGQRIFSTEAMAASDWLLAGGVASILLIIEETAKAVRRHRVGASAS
ncbi:MAG: calcium-translocating P-type ATPase, PMCA-type [Actinomycetia bacterium]|nr:calcium-translocating P-type ATPase, PMCA-type [Actinomycetes bacterium]